MSKRARKKVMPFRVGDRVKLCLDVNGRWKDAAGERLQQLQGTYGNVTGFVEPTVVQSKTGISWDTGIYVQLDIERPGVIFGFMPEDLQHVVYQIDEQP